MLSVAGGASKLTITFLKRLASAHYLQSDWPSLTAWRWLAAGATIFQPAVRHRLPQKLDAEVSRWHGGAAFHPCSRASWVAHLSNHVTPMILVFFLPFLKFHFFREVQRFSQGIVLFCWAASIYCSTHAHHFFSHTHSFGICTHTYTVAGASITLARTHDSMLRILSLQVFVPPFPWLKICSIIFSSLFEKKKKKWSVGEKFWAVNIKRRQIECAEKFQTVAEENWPFSVGRLKFELACAQHFVFERMLHRINHCLRETHHVVPETSGSGSVCFLTEMKAIWSEVRTVGSSLVLHGATKITSQEICFCLYSSFAQQGSGQCVNLIFFQVINLVFGLLGLVFSVLFLTSFRRCKSLNFLVQTNRPYAW